MTQAYFVYTLITATSLCLDNDVFSACFHPDLLFVLFLQLLAVRPDAGSRGLYGRPGSVPQKRL